LSRTLQLYQLQTLDSEIDKTRQQLAEVRARLGESEALKRAREALHLAEATLRKAQTTMQDLDLEVKSLGEKIVNQEKRLYGGKILNAKEAANLQEEVAALKRRNGEREERLLEAMLAVEEDQETLTQRQVEFSTIEATWSADQAQLQANQETLNQQLSQLLERRPLMADSLQPDLLREYDGLRSKKAGRAIVAVKDGVCQGCGIAMSNSRVQRARTDDSLTYCSTCGRILYVP
jgi:predicted  nucleic acid-binding Zn-ribbon protein